MTRAEASGYKLSAHDAKLVKGMIARGDRHHDIAAWFGVNQGRIAEVNNGSIYHSEPMAMEGELPPQGPYMSGRSAHSALSALEDAKSALELATDAIDQKLDEIKNAI